MRQGDIHYVKSERTLGRRFSLTVTRPRAGLVVIVSSGLHHDVGLTLLRESYVWTVPVDAEERVRTAHIAHVPPGAIGSGVGSLSPLDREGLIDQLAYNIVGTAPHEMYGGSDFGRMLHEANIKANRSPVQGDVVRIRPSGGLLRRKGGDDGPYLVVSGPAFNNLPDNELVWVIPWHPDDFDETEMISSVHRGRLSAPIDRVGGESLTHRIDLLRYILYGGLPNPDDAPPSPI